MTVEKPQTTGHIWMVNGTEMNVDMYVNYAAEAEITDIKPLEIGPIFEVDGTQARPYQAYTFEFRLKDDVDGPVMAAASIPIEEGQSYAGVLHRLPSGDFQVSIYENDFAPTANSRITVRHNAYASQLQWQIEPAPQADPQIQEDFREGALQPGEWQSATEVIDNEYTFEVLENGNVTGRLTDLEPESEKFLAIYLVGDPVQTSDPIVLASKVLVQEYQVPAKSQAGPAEVTNPAAPDSSADSNSPVVFTCEAVEVFETNPNSTQVTAVDADGWVNNLSIDRVDPDLGSIEIPDGQISLSSDIGEPASAEVAIGDDVPDGNYMIRIASNRGTIAQQEFCTIDLTVNPITVQRLIDQVGSYEATGDIDDGFATKLGNILDNVAAHLDDGDTNKACKDLTKFQDKVGNQAGNKVSTQAADDLTIESEALGEDLVCG